jgi:hypothetical protein
VPVLPERASSLNSNWPESRSVSMSRLSMAQLVAHLVRSVSELAWG